MSSPNANQTHLGFPSLRTKPSSQRLLESTRTMLGGKEFNLDRTALDTYTKRYNSLVDSYGQLPHDFLSSCISDPDRKDIKLQINQLHDAVKTRSEELRAEAEAARAAAAARTSSSGWSGLTAPSFGIGYGSGYDSGFSSPPYTGGTETSGHSGWPSAGGGSGYPPGPGSGAGHAHSLSVASSTSHLTVPSVQTSTHQQSHAGGSATRGPTIFEPTTATPLPNFTPTSTIYDGFIAINGQHYPVQVYVGTNRVLAYKTQHQSQLKWYEVRVVG